MKAGFRILEAWEDTSAFLKACQQVEEIEVAITIGERRRLALRMAFRHGFLIDLENGSCYCFRRTAIPILSVRRAKHAP